MKTTITILAAFFVMLNVTHATVLTVSNDPVGGAQFGSMLAAYNAAVNGDTLLFEGTNINYTMASCNAGWNKSLTVIGIGFNPQKQSPRRTLFAQSDNCCCGEFVIHGSGSGSSFYGITFVSGVRVRSATSNLTFEDCSFDGGNPNFNIENVTASNFTWRNCVFNGNSISNINFSNGSTTNSNMLVSNCVFDGYIEGQNSPFITLLVDHCLFLGANTFSQLHFAIIQNSIFMNVFPAGVTNSAFTNNMCRVAGTFPPVGGGGNSAAGNIEATNPNFVTYTNGAFYSTGHNYHVQSGSPAIGAATDATEIGLHGGLTHFSESGEVLINPIMRTLHILNSTIAPNGTLNVNINATKPTDN